MSLAHQRKLVADMLGELYEQIDHLPRPMLEALAPALAQAQREVEKDLRAWLAREGGDARFTTQRLRRSLVQVRRTMERVKKSIDPTIMRGLRIGANAAGKLATAHVSFELERFGSIFGTPMTSTVALDEAAVLAKGERLLVNRFAKQSRTYTREMRARIGAELAVSKLRGETVDEAATRLQGALERVFRGERWRADRLARTELMHAYNVQHAESVKQLHEQDPGIRMRWDAYFDRRTCLHCASLDGQLLDPGTKGGAFEANWTTKSGRALKGRHSAPPAHPNCRCVLVAWRADWHDDAFRHDQAARDGAHRDVKPDNVSQSAPSGERVSRRMRDYLEQAERSPRGVSGIGNKVNQKALEERGLVKLGPDPTTRDPAARVAHITDKGRAMLADLRKSASSTGNTAKPLTAPSKTTTGVQSRIRPRTVREVPVPRGFERPPTDGPRVPVVRGLPDFGQVNHEGLYAVRVEDLRRAGVFALPGGGEDPARLARIRTDWRAGKRYGPLSLVMGADGRLFVEDGRHRLITALKGGPRIPRTLLIRLDRAAPGAFEGLVRL